MYTEHFELSEEPFSIAANPRFLYMSAQHREALAHLLYGIRSDSGFVMLTGEVGTGKTTVCRCLLQQLPENSNVAYILNPKVTVEELLGSVCDEFHIGYPQNGPSVKTYVDAINRYLLEQHALGRNNVIIIDEAQNLATDLLEQLRLLTNLETNERKLVRIILLGQPELETMLSRPELKQVEQRITARYHLEPLERGEIQAYVSHRLAVAGCRKTVFSPRAIDRLHAKTRGIPRLINIVCDRAMLGAYVKSRHKVSPGILDRAAREVQGRAQRRQWFLKGSFVATSLLVGATAMAALLYHNGSVISWPLLHQPESPAADGIAGQPEGGARQPALLAALESSPPRAGAGDAGLAAWPDAATAVDGSQAIALAALFEQWEQDLDAGIADPCTQAIDRGLRCYSGIGNLGTLIGNDRPAVLTLLDSEGRQYDATLLALENGTATVAFAHGIETVSVRELEARWRGRYRMLWRITPQGLSILRPGESGPGINWLTRGLVASGVAPLQVKDIYDADVVEAVKAFQRSRGLVADGIVGRQTIIHLNSVNDRTIPRLTRQGEA